MHTGSQLEAHTYIIILQRVNGVKRLKIRYAQWWCNTLRWVGDVLHSLVNAFALHVIFVLFVIRECNRFLICTVGSRFLPIMLLVAGLVVRCFNHCSIATRSYTLLSSAITGCFCYFGKHTFLQSLLSMSKGWPCSIHIVAHIE